MSGTLNAERDARPPKAGSSPPGAPDSTLSGFEIRVDAAHTDDARRSAAQPGPRQETPPPPVPVDGRAVAAQPATDAKPAAPIASGDAPAEAASASEPALPEPAASSRSAVGYDNMIIQAGQIAEHLREQSAELDRREFRLHEQLVLLDQERRDVRMWVANCDAQADEREASLAAREQECAERTQSCLALEQELQELHQTLLRERHALATDQERLQDAREDQARELEAARAQLARERTQQEADLETDRERLQVEFRQERILFENRFRFQQEHLQKSRQEFEIAQAEFRTEQQVAWTRLDETQSQIRLRSSQLKRLRELCQAREDSVERERTLLFKSRRAQEDGLRIDREHLQSEQAAWEQERETQRADLRRQQDMLALHAENLETRRSRLDRLRAEMEETNRGTLELRLAVEEAFAQLAQAAGGDVARHRVDEARRILAEHYRYTLDALTQQRQDLEQIQMRVQQQRDELKAERQALATWAAEREDLMRQREQNLSEERAAWSQQQTSRDAAREHWTHERLEAESIIRDLLQQLADRELAPATAYQAPIVPPAAPPAVD